MRKTPTRPTVPEVAMRRIGPREAAMLLDRNRGNRKIRRTHVEQLAADMKAGRFVTNGDTIRVADDGTLLDGQHRLTAIVESGVTAWLPVMTGLPKSVQRTMDIGAKRHVADGLRFDGLDLPKLKGAAAVARAALLAERGGQYRPTNVEIHELVASDPALFQDAANVGNRLRAAGFRGGVGFYGSAYAKLRSINRPLCEAFFDQLISGADLPAGSPLLLLRRIYVGSNLRHLTNNGAQLRTALWQFYAAWNAWRADRPLKQRNRVEGVTPH